MIQLLCCCRGGIGVCKGQCEGTAALRSGGRLCCIEHCSCTDQASAQVLSEEVDFGGNPIDGIWPNSLPVTCLIALQGRRGWSSVLKRIKLTLGELAGKRVMKLVGNRVCVLKHMQWA